MNTKQKPILSEKAMDYLLVISLFMSAYVISKTPAEIYLSYVPMFLLLPILIAKYGIPKLVLQVFLPIILMGFIYIELGQNTWAQFTKIAVGFFTSILFFDLIIQR